MFIAIWRDDGDLSMRAAAFNQEPKAEDWLVKCARESGHKVKDFAALKSLEENIPIAADIFIGGINEELRAI